MCGRREQRCCCKLAISQAPSFCSPLDASQRPGRASTRRLGPLVVAASAPNRRLLSGAFRPHRSRDLKVPFRSSRSRILEAVAAIQGSAMLRDDSGNGGGRAKAPRNIVGDRLEDCSMKPLTRFFRDGCCNTSQEDTGIHTVCAVMTPELTALAGRARGEPGAPRGLSGYTRSRPRLLRARRSQAVAVDLA
jgi:hypothetical protein